MLARTSVRRSFFGMTNSHWTFTGNARQHPAMPHVRHELDMFRKTDGTRSTSRPLSNAAAFCEHVHMDMFRILLERLTDFIGTTDWK
jgi:hypothetical protein